MYRLSSRRFPASNSEGARRYGGRWNHPGTPVIYTSSTRSLAALEVLAHNGAIPADYHVVVVDVPDNVAIESIALEQLPRRWPRDTQAFDTAEHGTQWARSLRTAVLRVPSAVIPSEVNYILNPLHREFAEIRFDAPGDEYIDDRLQR